MIEMSIAEIAEIVGGRLDGITPEEARNMRVTGTVEFDSRQIGPGGLFLALPGARVDGHDHAVGAIAAGAVAVLAARPVGVPAIVVSPTGVARTEVSALEHDSDGSGAAVLAATAALATEVSRRLVAQGLRIVGVTGSSGKTSTKDLIAAVLTPLGEVVAPPGSFNNELGHPWTVLRATGSTKFLVLELSARRPGNIADLAAIAPPSIGVVLNVGTAHLGEFGSRQAIADTKGELPQSLSDDGVAVLNVDDSAVSAMAAKTGARVVRTSVHNPADIWATDVTVDELARARFILNAGENSVSVQLAVHGEHQVGNALAAAAVALECGATLTQVASALEQAGPVSRRRMEVSTRADGVTVINDAYNANPDSMMAGLKALVSMARHGRQARRSWAVLGEMAELGPDAISEHDRIGRAAVRLDVSRLVVVGTGRSQRAMHAGAVMEGSWGSEAVLVDDPAAAATLLSDELAAGDVVLVKASQSAGLWVVADELLARRGDGPDELLEVRS
ncbi:MAG: UDP-N-acetylmuramoyl-tripeptide--D-alanyl-D-alanine ligase [Mycobacterium sp.]